MSLGTSPTDTSIWKINYEYGETDSNGNVDLNKNTGSVARQTVSFAGLTQPFVQSYRYDSLYRITEARETNGPATNASQNWKETFGYDRFGNRTTFAKFSGTTQLALDNKTNPSIDPATNRFNPNQGYLYDKNGNLISDAEGRSFVFNGENKQSQIIKDGKLVGEYDYNARASGSESGPTTPTDSFRTRPFSSIRSESSSPNTRPPRRRRIRRRGTRRPICWDRQE